MQWGWNPDSIAALTTALAALAAVVAGFFAWGAYRAESEARDLARQGQALAERGLEADRAREARELELERRAQAELVSAWAVVRDSAVPSVELRVQNLSAAPVYAVTAGFELTGFSSQYAKWIRVLPSTGSEARNENVKDGAIAGWTKWIGSRRPCPVPYVEFTFRDARGAWWLRDGSGVLSEISESERWRYGTEQPLQE